MIWNCTRSEQADAAHQLFSRFLLMLWLIPFATVAAQPEARFFSEETQVYGSALNGPSGGLVVNADSGRRLLFRSYAGNLLEGESGADGPLFLKDLEADWVRRIAPGAGLGGYALSPEGNFVAYVSNGRLFLLNVDSSALEELWPVPVASGVSLATSAQFVFFESADVNSLINNLPGNTHRQIVRWDRFTGDFRLISSNSQGLPGNGDSTLPKSSRSGNQVAFLSTASDLMQNDNNGFADAFAWLGGSNLVMASRTAAGAQADSDVYDVSLSANGRYLAFVSHSANLRDVELMTSDPLGYSFDVVSRELVQSSAGSPVSQPTIADSGALLTYIAGIGINREVLQKAAFGPSELVTLVDRGERPQSPLGAGLAVTASGDQVFYSADPIQVGGCALLGGPSSCEHYVANIYRKGVEAGDGELVSLAPRNLANTAMARNFSGAIDASADGSLVSAFWQPHGAPNRRYFSIVDLASKEIATWFSTYGQLSANGQFVIYSVPLTYGRQRLDLWDRENQTVTAIAREVSIPDQVFDGNVLASSDGVAFADGILTYLGQDLGVLAFDTINNTVEVVSISDDGAQEAFDGRLHAASPDGRYVLFTSRLVLIDQPNGFWQLFLRDRVTQTTELISTISPGIALAGDTDHADISDDGEVILIETDAPELFAEPEPHGSGVFLRSRSTGSTQRISPAGIGSCGHASMSGDAGYIVFWCWVDGRYFVYDAKQERLTPIPVPAHATAVTEAIVRGSESIFLVAEFDRHADVPGLPGDLSSTLQGLEISLSDPFFDTVFEHSFE